MASIDSDQLELDQPYSSFPDFQHLNIDLCFELIFPYLNVKDLANAADTCTQMKRAAEIIFAHKYKETLFFINIKSYECNDKQYEYTSRTYYNSICLYDRKMCYQILRCFGHLIQKLQLIYYRLCITESIQLHFDEYVSNYCANYITELHISERKHGFESLQNTSFPNVEKVHLTNCNLDRFITKFDEIFPKMRSLELATAHSMYTKIDDQSRIIQDFPHLEHLSINILDLKSEFKEENVISILKANPHIRSLNLCSDWWALKEEFLRSISKICESLDVLQITGSPLKIDATIHFKSVKIFKIDHYCYGFESPITLTFDALEIFEWSSVSPFGSFVFEFIRKNPTISKLRLHLLRHSIDNFTHDKFIEMKISFAFVKEIEIMWSCVDEFKTVKEITIFLDNCKSLQRLVLKATNEADNDQLIKLSKSLQNVVVTIDKKKKCIICQKPIKMNE